MNIIHTLKNSVRQEETILILTLTSCWRVCRQLRTSTDMSPSVYIFLWTLFLCLQKCMLSMLTICNLYMHTDADADATSVVFGHPYPRPPTTWLAN